MKVKHSKSKNKSSCFMAGGIRRTVRRRKGRPYWYVFWTENGKQERKSTEVLIVQNGLEEDETLHLAHSKAASMFGSEDNRDVIIANEDLKAARKKLDIARGGVNQPTIEVYFENLKLTGKPKTLENKRIVVSRFLKFLGKDVKKKVDFITKDKLQQFFNLLSKDHAANTIKTMRDYLRACLTEALEKHYIPQNPFTGLELPKFDKKEAKLTRYRYIPTCETVAEMMKRLPDPWPTVIWLTLQTCGQRIGDIVRCKWESISFARREISFVTEKTGKRGLWYMDDRLVGMLKPLYEARGREEYIFPSLAHKTNISSRFTELLKKHGLARNLNFAKPNGELRHRASITFHDLRRFCVTEMRISGVSPDMCRDLVGHDSEEIEQVYIVPSDEERKKNSRVVTSRLAKLLSV